MVELQEKRLRKSLSEAKNEWQGQKDLNPRHAVLERLTEYSISSYNVNVNLSQGGNNYEKSQISHLLNAR